MIKKHIEEVCSDHEVVIYKRLCDDYKEQLRLKSAECNDLEQQLIDSSTHTTEALRSRVKDLERDLMFYEQTKLDAYRLYAENQHLYKRLQQLGQSDESSTKWWIKSNHELDAEVKRLKTENKNLKDDMQKHFESTEELHEAYDDIRDILDSIKGE